jgi:hypothetical protein
MCVVAGCSARAEPAGRGAEGTTERADAFTVGIERIVPIQVVLVRTSHDGTSPARTPFTEPEVRERTARLLSRTNQVWRPTGIRFSVASVRQEVEPTFASNALAHGSVVSWSAGLKTRLETVLGTAVWASDPASGQSFSEVVWLHAAELKFGKPDAVYATFAMESPQGFCDAWQRACSLAGLGDSFGDSVHLAHEFGHAFGLAHVYAAGYDPRTALPQTPEDLWDMFYCPGTSAASPNRYYLSAQDSPSAPPCTAPGGRTALGTGDYLPGCVPNALASCASAPGAALPPGQLNCKVQGVAGSGYCEVKTQFATGLYNVLTFSAPGTAGTLSGSNIMSYVAPTNYRSFSPAQVRVIRDSLRYDHRIDREPLVDDSNTAEWTIRSSPGYAAGPPVRRFGRLDDLPVPGFYDADAITDQAVYRPGEVGSGASTEQSRWYWCPSAGSTVPPSCEFGGYAAATFGTREDVPLPGLNWGSGRYLAVYRPSNGTFYWTQIGVWTVFSRQVAQPNTPSFPIVGRFDADDLVDFATYDPVTARFDLVLSTLAWSVASKRIRVFPSNYRRDTDPATTPSQRAGGWPVPGVRRALPIAGSPVREVFALYDPDAGRGDVAWDVLSATSSPYAASVTPFATLGDAVLGGITGTPSPYDALIGIQWGAPATISVALPDAAGTFPGTTPVSTSLNITNDMMVGILQDVSGDNVPDLFVHDGETGNVVVLTSPTFTTGATLPLGGPFAQPL